MDIYLRPLRESDAAISYRWRNDPEVWKFTASKPDRIITPEIEAKWISEVLSREDEHRFAICLKESDTYVGNVQLTKVRDKKAEFHIFIGDVSFWGKGIGKQATQKMINLAFASLGLEEVYLRVKRTHHSAIKMYQDVGFGVVEQSGGWIKMKMYAS